MVFFNDFISHMEHAVSDVAKVVRAPVDFIEKEASRLPKADFTLLNPIKEIEHIIDHPEDVKFVGDIIGEGLEVVGAITAQPELIGLGLAVKGGADLVGGVAGVAGAVKGKDLGGIATALGGLGNKLSGLSALEESENKQLVGISKTLEGVGKHISDIDTALGITNKLLNKEIKADITNNEQMKQFIQDNHGENEALKHGQVILDNDLQSLAKEERKEEDVLNQIRTAIDVPTTDSDFVKDISNFNNPKAILEYMAENLGQIEGLDTANLDAILDLALQRGVLNAI